MANNFIQVVFTVLSFVYDVITFPVYIALQKPWKRRQLSRRIKVYINSGKNTYNCTEKLVVNYNQCSKVVEICFE